MKIKIEANYSVNLETEVKLPSGKNWSDVTSYHVKWGVIYGMIDDKHVQIGKLDIENVPTSTAKFPRDTVVWRINRNGEKVECLG